MFLVRIISQSFLDLSLQGLVATSSWLLIKSLLIVLLYRGFLDLQLLRFLLRDNNLLLLSFALFLDVIESL